MKIECYDSVRKWMISLLSVFLPVHLFGFIWNNNLMSVAQMCENNGQGEWNFLVLKISQRKANRESHGCRFDIEGHPTWSRCVKFRWSVQQPKDFNGKCLQRGYPDEWMQSLEISTKEMRRLYIQPVEASIWPHSLRLPTVWPIWFAELFVDCGSEI